MRTYFKFQKATLVRSFVSTPSTQFHEKDDLHKGDHYCQVPDRSLLELEGPDTSKFLQGLITNHMPKISLGGDGIYAAFLTPPVTIIRRVNSSLLTVNLKKK
jgi:folate-binding Fe-S cluster repair protein YgfZ